MGKKSRKKKTGKTTASSSSSSAASSSAAATAVLPSVAGEGEGRGGYADDTILPAGTSLVALPSSCFHGSNLADFKNPEYIGAIQAYISMCFDAHKLGLDNQAIANQHYDKFYDDHEHLRKHDTDFRRFVFAYCTHFYQKYYHLSGKNKFYLTSLLRLGLQMRYQNQVEKGVGIGPGSENYEKTLKYNRDVCSERGIINCLIRETPCGCMDSKKAEGKGMDKTNPCLGCCNPFPKTSLFYCTGCQTVQYCSKACQVNEWPSHRNFCKSLKQQRANKSCIKSK